MSLDYNRLPEQRMADLLFLDKAVFWINVTYLASVCLALISGLLAIVLSYQRAAAAESETRKLQLEYAQQAAVANERAAASNEAAEHARAEGAATAAAGETLRKQNLDLGLALEREKRMRLEMEDRMARQSAAATAPPRPNAPRMLTLEQEHELTSAMSRFGRVNASLIELSDAEAGPLGQDIARLLQSANWNIFVSRFGALVPPQHGIVCTHDANNPAAAAFVKTLRSFDLTVYERSGAEGQFEILVGLKPPNDR